MNSHVGSRDLVVGPAKQNHLADQQNFVDIWSARRSRIVSSRSMDAADTAARRGVLIPAGVSATPIRRHWDLEQPWERFW